MPQFLATGLASIIFAIFDPQKLSLPHHRAPIVSGPSLNSTLSVAAANAVVSRGRAAFESLLLDNSTQGKVELDDSSPPDAVVYVFRLVNIFLFLFNFL